MLGASYQMQLRQRLSTSLRMHAHAQGVWRHVQTAASCITLHQDEEHHNVHHHVPRILNHPPTLRAQWPPTLAAKITSLDLQIQERVISAQRRVPLAARVVPGAC
jgi:hypothetical protein